MTFGFDDEYNLHGFMPIALDGNQFYRVKSDEYRVAGRNAYYLRVDGPSKSGLLSPRYETRGTKQVFICLYRMVASSKLLSIAFPYPNIKKRSMKTWFICAIIASDQKSIQ